MVQAEKANLVAPGQYQPYAPYGQTSPYGTVVKPEDKVKEDEKKPGCSTATLAAVGAGGLLVGTGAGAYAGHELNKLPYTHRHIC